MKQKFKADEKSSEILFQIEMNSCWTKLPDISSRDNKSFIGLTNTVTILQMEKNKVELCLVWTLSNWIDTLVIYRLHFSLSDQRPERAKYSRIPQSSTGNSYNKEEHHTFDQEKKSPAVNMGFPGPYLWTHHVVRLACTKW